MKNENETSMASRDSKDFFLLDKYRKILQNNDYLINSLEVMEKIPYPSISQRARIKELEEYLIPDGIREEKKTREKLGLFADSPLPNIPTPRKDFTGWIGWTQPEGFLTIEAITGYASGSKRLARCRCSCGSLVERPLDVVLKQHTRSCGCKKWQNCSNTRNNVRIELDGELVTLAEASRRTGINRQTLVNRLRAGKNGADLIQSPRRPSKEERQ